MSDKSDIEFELALLKDTIEELKLQNESHPGTLSPDWINSKTSQALYYIRIIEKLVSNL